MGFVMRGFGTVRMPILRCLGLIVVWGLAFFGCSLAIAAEAEDTNSPVLYYIPPEKWRKVAYDATSGSHLYQLEQQLGQIRALGINTLWLPNIFKETGHRDYHINFSPSVDPQYGTDTEFVRLVQAASEGQITVLIEGANGATSAVNIGDVSTQLTKDQLCQFSHEIYRRCQMLNRHWIDSNFKVVSQKVVFGEEDSLRLSFLYEADDYYGNQSQNLIVAPHFDSDLSSLLTSSLAESLETQSAKLQLLYGLAFLGRGVPLIYAGDENFGNRKFSYKNPIFQSIARLSQLYERHPVFGDGIHLNRYGHIGERVYGFSRLDPNKPRDYLVVFNFNEQPKAIQIPTRTQSYHSLYPFPGDEYLTQDGMLSLNLAPLSMIVLQGDQWLAPFELPGFTMVKPSETEKGNSLFTLVAKSDIDVDYGMPPLFNMVFTLDSSDSLSRYEYHDFTPPYRLIWPYSKQLGQLSVSLTSSNSGGSRNVQQSIFYIEAQDLAPYDIKVEQLQSIVANEIDQRFIRIAADMEAQEFADELAAEQEERVRRAQEELERQKRLEEERIAKEREAAELARKEKEALERKLVELRRAEEAKRKELERKQRELERQRKEAEKIQPKRTADVWEEEADEPEDDSEPYPATIYLRGDVIGTWAAIRQFKYEGNKTYALKVYLRRGSYEFKIATAKWDVVNIGAGRRPRARIEKTTKLLRESNPANILIRVEENGDYLFELNAEDPFEPLLTIRKL
jgi:hypothetical protein